ncbi:MAG: hypothetical protein ACTSRG_24635 [Candidatus Helarchaeota archaeon]
MECCGHLSAFTIDQVISQSERDEWSGNRLMNIKLEKILAPGMRFIHEYDFVTTTELVLRVLSEQENALGNKSIKLMARNLPPLIKCVKCGELATNVCSECIYDDGGWLCDDCATDHECGEEILMPVVNSPRVGMCGYMG